MLFHMIVQALEEVTGLSAKERARWPRNLAIKGRSSFKYNKDAHIPIPRYNVTSTIGISLPPNAKQPSEPTNEYVELHAWMCRTGEHPTVP